MNLIEELRRDHAGIQAVLSAIEDGSGEAQPLQELAARIPEQFRLEEELLLTRLERGFPPGAEPLAALRREQRDLERFLQEATENGKPSRAVLEKVCRDVRRLLGVEEVALFQFSERLFNAEELSALGAAYRQSRSRAVPAREEITVDTRIADLARKYPATIRVFQSFGIDFCCGGKLPIGEACRKHGLAVGSLLADLRESVEAGSRSGEPDWVARPAVEIVGHVLARYHAGLRDELLRLNAMARRAAERHGDAHPELVLIRDLVSRLAEEMSEHLEREEREIFPALLRGDAEALSGEIESAEREHEVVGDLLSRLRAVTDGYVAPAEACNTWRGLFHGLSELERDTHMHVHLENNILFPKALESCPAR